MKYSLAIVFNWITQHQLSQQSVLGVKGCASKVAMSHSVERPNPVRGDFQTQNQVKLGKPPQPLQTPHLLYKNHFPTSKLGKPGEIQDPLPPTWDGFPSFSRILVRKSPLTRSVNIENKLGLSCAKLRTSQVGLCLVVPTSYLSS